MLGDMSRYKLIISFLLLSCGPGLLAQQVINGNNNNAVFVPPTVVPGGFTTRKTGTRMNVTAVGTARNVSVVKGQAPHVELTLRGKTKTTFPGQTVRVDGLLYKSMGWQKDHFLLFCAAKRKSIYFARSVKK